jgi:hypothetical protein
MRVPLADDWTLGLQNGLKVMSVERRGVNMLRVEATTMAIIACCWASVWGQPPVVRTNLTTITYDDFMQIDTNQRLERFNQLTAESKATIVRTHGERWLAENRGRLDRSEIVAFESAIAFVTPQLYQLPPDPQVMKKQLDFGASLECRVNPDDVMAIFDVFGRRTSTSAKTEWTYLSRAKCWFWSIAESVVRYLPTIRR